jgi:ankyrin repeat protein
MSASEATGNVATFSQPSRDKVKSHPIRLLRPFRRPNEKPGLKFNERDHDGMTILHRAVIEPQSRSQQSMGEFMQEIEAAPILLRSMTAFASSGQKAALDVNARDYLGRTPLHWAAILGRVEEMYDLLSHPKTDRNARDKEGRTPLHEAVMRAQTDAVHGLVLPQNGNPVEIDIQDNQGRTSFHWLPETVTRVTNDTINIADILIVAGAELASTDISGDTVLHRIALQKPMWPRIRDLLEPPEPSVFQNARLAQLVHRPNKFGNTPAHMALSTWNTSGNTYTFDREIVQKLVDMTEADKIDVVNSQGNSLLHLAAMHGYDQILWGLMQRGADAGLRNKDEKTPIFLAAENGNDRVVTSMMTSWETESKRNQTDVGAGLDPEKIAEAAHALIEQWRHLSYSSRERNETVAHLYHWAARQRRLDVATALIENKFLLVDMSKDVNRHNYNELPELEFSPLELAALEGFVQLVEYLLDHPDFDSSEATVSEREGALFDAVDHGQVEVVRVLLERRAVDVNALDRSGFTALAVALKQMHPTPPGGSEPTGSTDTMFDTLLSRPDIDLDLGDPDYKKPLCIAVRAGLDDAVQRLLDRGANPNLTNPGDMHSKSSLLFESIFAENKTIVRSLIAHGADVNVFVPANPGHSWPLLMFAFSNEFPPNQRDYARQVLLEQADIDVNLADSYLGETAVFQAIRDQDEDAVRALAATGKVDWERRNNQGETALDLAHWYSVNYSHGGVEAGEGEGKGEGEDSAAVSDGRKEAAIHEIVRSYYSAESK